MGVSLIELVGVVLTGMLLGSLFFGGLWLTVRHASRWRNPGLAVAASLLVRFAIVAIGLYLLADGHWQRYVAAVPGLWAARWLWVRRIRAPGANR
ncbi:MAG: ATP synthase subunit I [Methylotetracoccus sp.]|nr:ATP synthase subunit I [Methylotetracoccus sp.]